MTPLEKAQAEYVRLYTADVTAHPRHYKARVVADPEEYARQMIDGLDLADVRRLTNEHRAELRALGRAVTAL